jgi:hypothetical protein
MFMETKAMALAGLLNGQKIVSVTIETPDDTSVIKEITLDHQDGINYTFQEAIITFTCQSKTASFEILDTTLILPQQDEHGLTIATYAQNGGLQIWCLPDRPEEPKPRP